MNSYSSNIINLLNQEGILTTVENHLKTNPDFRADIQEFDIMKAAHNLKLNISDLYFLLWYLGSNNPIYNVVLEGLYS